MEKSDNKELIQRFIDNTLSEDEKAVFKDKFKNDPEFAKEVRSFADSIVALQAAGKMIKQDNENKKSKQIFFTRILLVAASVLLIVAFTWFFIDKPLETISEDNNLINEKPEWLLAENFVDNPTIENALSQNLRSMFNDISIISPIDSSFFEPEDTILFQLDNCKGLNYSLVIYDNKFNKIFQSETLQKPYLKYVNSKDEGLFYWKFLIDNSSFWGGKFYVVAN